MKTLILLLTLTLSAGAVADCYDQITQNSRYSSRVFKLESDEVEEYEDFNEKMALEVLNVLLIRETSCKVKDVAKPEQLVKCIRFPHSGMTCEVATTIGYFIIHRSSFGSFEHSIIYTRWD